GGAAARLGHPRAAPNWPPTPHTLVTGAAVARLGHPRLRGPAHVGGRLVVAEAEEDGVAQAAVARLLHEADLPDQRRLEPRRVPHPWRVEEGRRRAPQRREPLRELGERLAREAGAGLARIPQP